MNSQPGSKGKIIVTGIVFWYPLAGVTYQFLHYLIGLRRLGYDPYYVEDSGRYVYDPILNDLSPDAESNVRSVTPVLERYGFAGKWAFRGAYPGGKCYGMPEQAILQLYREADALLNVTGAQEIREEHLACRRRVYVESDPFASQVRAAQGDKATVAAIAAHDIHFSFGENLGNSDCDVPMNGVKWHATRQPVVLDLWRHTAPAGAAYNTITTWHNKAKPITYRGNQYYWTKDREFERFLDLPRRSAASFEIAATVNNQIRDLLQNHGWRQLDSVSISRDMDSYRRYIQQSRGEFTVARDQYTRPNTGWFSDRTVCYLAAGRPVITQETGFSKFLPTGRGLFGFKTMEDILKAVETIESDYEGNCRAASEIADEYFAAEKVVGHLMSRAGL
ncbi:MAG TPA: hypothetical protein VL285_17040 [Bryobacteraceae bacterium]|nr:hypothetical protein [Bryobacteraceae bacterium]